MKTLEKRHQVIRDLKTLIENAGQKLRISRFVNFRKHGETLEQFPKINTTTHGKRTIIT